MVVHGKCRVPLHVVRERDACRGLPKSVQLRANDVVLVPEEWVQHIPSDAARSRQGDLQPERLSPSSCGASRGRWSGPHTPGDGRRRVATVSDDNLDYIRYVFPRDGNCLRIQQVIDPATFYVDSSKTQSVAYMPREAARRGCGGARHPRRGSGALDGWEVVAIAGRSEAQTAAIMRQGQRVPVL